MQCTSHASAVTTGRRRGATGNRSATINSFVTCAFGALRILVALRAQRGTSRWPISEIDTYPQHGPSVVIIYRKDGAGVGIVHVHVEQRVV